MNHRWFYGEKMNGSRGRYFGFMVWGFCLFVSASLFSGNAEAIAPENITSPLQNLYYHISDDDGTTPTQDTDVILLFEPQSRALLYVQSTSDLLAFHGNWSYTLGHLSIRFASGDFNVRAEFGIDLDQAEVEMPFRAFSSQKGSSRWRCRPVVVENAVRFVFRGAVMDQNSPSSSDEAIARAVDYANAVIASRQEMKRLVSEYISGPFSAPDIHNDIDWSKVPVKAKSSGSGIEVGYQDGSMLELLLFSWAPPPPGHLNLTPKRLVKDPRVHLNVEPSGDTRFDPENKVIFFISPFNSARIISWYDRLTNKGRASGVVPYLLSDHFAWDSIKARLAEKGYDNRELINESVTIERLIKIFTELENPGIVIFYTHGAASGSLCTGEQLTDTGDAAEAHRKFEEVKERLIRAGHRRLVDGGGIGKISIELTLKVPQDCAWFVSIKPPFWKYLQNLVARPVSFKKSLFFTAACLTDKTPHLREAVQAGAYFTWKESISPDLNGAVFQYLVEDLCRPTRSAEEAYYNLVRVVNTREIIYKEDRILQGHVPTSAGQNRSPLFQNLNNYLFNGYGLNGSNLIGYAGNGWLDPAHFDVGQLWWMVFAGRWGKSAKVGADNLRDCYQKYWSAKKFGRLKAPFCNAANNGKIPRKAEVDYACYLLTGETPQSYQGKVVPRWTLNEAR